MSREFGGGKRQREADKTRKRQDKEDRRRQRRAEGPRALEASAADNFSADAPSVEEIMAQMEGRGGGASRAAPIPARLFVGGLSQTTDDRSLRAAFEPYGVVAEAVVIEDRDTGSSRGFGFVTMQDRKDAAKAIEALDDSDLDGRRLHVRVATDRR